MGRHAQIIPMFASIRVQTGLEIKSSESLARPFSRMGLAARNVQLLSRLRADVPVTATVRIMLVGQTLQLVGHCQTAGRRRQIQCSNREDEQQPNLLPPSKCSRSTGYIGSKKMAKSVAVLVAANAYQKASLLMHFTFGTDSSQAGRIGKH